MKAAKIPPSTAYYSMYLRIAIAKGTDANVAEILNEMHANNIPMLSRLSSQVFSMSLS
jgi:hypothetical protein